MSQATIQTLYFLRWVQMGSTLITGFIACYLVWWHNWYFEDVPYGLSAIICTSIVTVVENYISQASTLSAKGPVQLNHARIFKTAGMTTVLMAYGYYSIFKVPDINFSTFCGMNEYSRMHGPTVERRNCALVCDIVVAGAIAVSFSAFTTLFAMVNVCLENNARVDDVEEGVSDYSDFVIGGFSDEEKKVLVA